jgi:hypothetical protein
METCKFTTLDKSRIIKKLKSDLYGMEIKIIAAEIIIVTVIMAKIRPMQYGNS